MKTNIILFILMITADACAMGGHSVKQRKDQDKMWHPCLSSETEKPIGKFCNNSCEKRKLGKCTKWKTLVRDFSKEEHFNFFRDGTFILIDEDQIK